MPSICQDLGCNLARIDAIGKVIDGDLEFLPLAMRMSQTLFKYVFI
jgi:hypothetical protein